MSSPQLTTAAYADRSYEALKPYKVVKPCSFISLHSNLTLLLSSFHGQRNRRPLPCSADRFTSSFVLREALYLRSSAQERIPQHPTHNSECSKPCPRASSMLLMFLSFLIASTGITLSILYQSVWFLIAQAFVLAVLFTLFISTVKLQYAARVPGVALSFANDAVYLSPRYEDPFPYLSISSIRHFGVVAVHRRERNIGQGVTGSEQASENSCYCLEVITLGEVLLIGSCTSKQSITIMADEANAHLQRMREEGIALFPPPSLFTEDQDDYQQASVQLTSTWDSSVILPRTHGVTVEHPGDQTVIIRFHNPQRCASSVKAILLVMLVSAMIYFVTNCENCHLLQRLYWTLPSVIYSVGMFLAMNFISCEWTTIVFSQERKPCFFVPP
ncbi:hypothetical protein BWQ96_10229 [Gracilariopsis chorda]|uniref:Uncharacterized protein n=1 Tax=Gracilariopsis chorda TaxID=448386 RepID=A0A2V3IFV8_9FLOR|nr:hypothetical protein BWQ96_10229 [Gracilariopsis chorda]|eukprot:PXF40060.1 hypothetical protein BWQ96_10229 [Gracilariopsis chorda]